MSKNRLAGSKRSISISIALAEVLAPRDRGNVSLAISQIAERYNEAVRRAVPLMSGDEWRAVYRVVHWWDPTTTGIAHLASQLEESLCELRPNGGWGFDEIEFIERAAGWDFVTRMAVVDTCERLVASSVRPSFAKALERLGVAVRQ